jgi:predicted nuclease of predicted toxin-antitoxin system
VGAARIAFHLDEHVPRAVAAALRRRGIDVLTAGEAGLLSASDSEHLAHAHAAGRVLVTHDSDFLRLHQQRQPHSGIAYCAQGARTIGQIVTSLVLIYELLTPAEIAGRIEFI